MSPYPFLALAAMLLDWFARWRANKPLEYIGKPLVIIFLIAWLYQGTHFAGGAGWFAAALAFSLLGDVLLMLPHERFGSGLAAFFVAQIVYIVSFNLSPFRVSATTFILALLVTAVGTWVYLRLSAGLVADGKPRLRMPLLFYSIALAGMLFSALAGFARPAWTALAAAVTALGAILFFVSDTLHGWNKFVRPLPLGRLLVHLTYHLGQLGITAGVILHFSGSLLG
jgi:alkenylglycerophosphocholine hydrolase